MPPCGTGVVAEGPITRCPNRFGCPAQLAGRIQHLASEGTLDIDGLGEKTARLLVDRGLVTELPDLFHLDAGDVEALEGFAARSARRLVDDIGASRDVALHRFLYGLGIPGVGETVARDLAEHFETLDAVRTAAPSDLRDAPGVGPKMAGVIRGFFEDERNQAVIDALLETGVARRLTRPTSWRSRSSTRTASSPCCVMRESMRDGERRDRQDPC